MKLNTCPFCGKHPEMMRWSAGFQVWCINTACKIRPNTMIAVSAMVSQANWNHREPTAQRSAFGLTAAQ